jgi:hypothetical protein
LKFGGTVSFLEECEEASLVFLSSKVSPAQILDAYRAWVLAELDEQLEVASNSLMLNFVEPGTGVIAEAEAVVTATYVPPSNVGMRSLTAGKLYFRGEITIRTCQISLWLGKASGVPLQYARYFTGRIFPMWALEMGEEAPLGRLELSWKPSRGSLENYHWQGGV